MLLKRLEIQGFKSFADKTVLEFGSGVTSVVGPNGSGKSNISDAIRWVMGEMSAKSLRGSNMQDIIFAGTEIRNRLNFAEVSLVLDNTKRIFPLEYDEIVVTRRVFRSGETGYQINRTNCRLRDIHELFMDTGLGRDGYSIIGQGNVAQILSTKAEDRRSLFEEAAGVSKYKYKKDESERKLTQVQDNIVRISDITAELEAQLAPLERQSEKARKYLVYYEEYKDLDINMAMVTLDKNKLEESEAGRQYGSVNGEIEAIREKEADAEAKISGLYDESKRTDEEQAAKNSELIDTQNKVMECTNDISLAQNTMKNNESMIVRIEKEILSVKNKNIQREKSIEELTQEIEECRSRLSDGVSELSCIQSEDKGISEKQAENNKRLDEIRERIAALSNTISAEKSKSEGIEALRRTYLLRQEALRTQRESLNSNLENTKKEIEQNRAQIDIKNEKLHKLKQLIASRESKKEELEASLSAIGEEKNRLRVEFNSKTSKRRIMEDMENEYEGYSKSVKSVLKSEQMKRLSIYGTVAGLIEVKREYTTAIEIALGNSLQNIIVESEDDAKAAIKFLRDTNGGRATFLPISSIRGRTLDNLNSIKNENGFIGVASELVSCTSKYTEIVRSLLGRIVVVDNIDNGIAMSRKFGYKFRIVTLAGDSLNSGGSMTGGSINKTGGFLSRAAEIKTLKSELVALEVRMKDTEAEELKIKSAVELEVSQLSSYIPMKREYEDEILKLESAVLHLQDTVENSGTTEESLDRELEETESSLSSSADEFARALNNVRNAENSRAAEEKSLEEAESEREELDETRKNRNQLLLDHNMKLSEYRSDIDSRQMRIDILRSEISSSQEEARQKEQDKENIRANDSALVTTIEEKTKSAKLFAESIASLTEKIAQISERKGVIVSKLQKIQGSNKELTDTLLRLQQELSRIEARQLKLSMEKESILNRLWEDYELTLSDAAERASVPENEKESGKRLAELKSKIKNLGSVNVDSIEEYKTVSDRYNFLSTQIADLEKSKDNLNKIIESMEELMKEYFTEQFTAINESFGFVFRELFGGGHGKLYLQEPDNVLESGIEIEVQLPGKGLQNINLYSGGEKSFIAIALLFSILRVKPAPFCILDEIDAALDDVNVSRFATYLKNYVDASQFIVITHRRGTMEAANILYGVTMQEKGVSKLLSLQIDDVDENMAE